MAIAMKRVQPPTTTAPPSPARRGTRLALFLFVLAAGMVSLVFALNLTILTHGEEGESVRLLKAAKRKREKDALSSLERESGSGGGKEADENRFRNRVDEENTTDITVKDGMQVDTKYEEEIEGEKGIEMRTRDANGDADAETNENSQQTNPHRTSFLESDGGRPLREEEEEGDISGAVVNGTYRNPFPPLNRSSSRPCTGSSYTSGRWVRKPDMRPRYPALGEILGCCQRGYEEEFGKGAQRPETQYVWESDSCNLHEWSEELFCRALRGRNMMIAGDSLNDHWHASLYYLLGGRKDIYRREGTVRGKRACGTHDICHKYYPKPLKIYFLTNQLLEEERRPFRNYKWWKHIHNYPILILNSGSWMRDPMDERREVSDEEYFGHMEKALRIVKRQNFTGTLIWRTTYQGHPYCWNYTEPLTRELTADEFPRVPPYLRYRWWAIPKRNEYTVDMWRKAGAHILDVRRITNLMPLGHLGRYHPKYKERNVTDCLHYCSPGPVYDTWSMLLMNLLAGNIDG